MTVLAPPTDNRLPFRSGTRRRVQFVGSYPITLGAPLPTITLPQTGMLARLMAKIEGTITQTAAAATLSPLGYAALISRARVGVNNGSQAIVDASGAGLELANFWHAPSTGRVQNTYANGAGVNAVSYGISIPINANDRTLLEIGLINLQAEQLRANVDFSFAAATEFLIAGGPVTASALTLFLYYEYWDVPNPTMYLLPPPSIVRILEDQQPIAAVGDLVYPIPRLGTITQISEYFILGATAATRVMANLTAPTPQISKFRIRANRTDEWLNYDARAAEIEEALFFNSNQGPSNTALSGSFMRPGVRTWDFFHSGLQTRNFGDRDLIDSEKITLLELVATVDGSVAPSAFTTRNIVRRTFQRLV